MLKTTEANDVKAIMKGFKQYGYTDQTAMDNDIVFIATQTEIMFRDTIGVGQYNYLQSLNGSFLNNSQSSTYFGEVYAIAKDMMEHIANKYKQNQIGGSISIPGFSRSNATGSSWFVKDAESYKKKYIEFMYIAGYRVNQVASLPNYYLNQINKEL